MNIGTIYAQIMADTSQLSSASRDFENFTSKASSSMNVVESSLVSTTAKIVSLAASAATLTSLAHSFIEVAASSEKMVTTLETLTQGKGVETFEALNAWAMRMPVNTQAAMQAWIQLKARGLDPTLKTMTILVDATAGLGGSAETLKGLTKALGDIQSRGKLSMEELNQLSDWGINARKILGDALKPLGQSLDDLAKKPIAASIAIKALLEGMEKQFGGLSVNMMKLWDGLMETLKSYWTEFIRLVSDAGAWEELKKPLKELVTYFDSIFASGAFQKMAETVSGYLVIALQVAVEAMRAFGEGVKYAWDLLSAIPSGVIDFFKDLKVQSDAARDSLKNTGLAVMETSGKEASGSNLTQMLESMNELSKDIISVWVYMGKVAGETVAYMVTVFVSGVQAIWQSWTVLINNLGSLIGTLPGVVSAVLQDVIAIAAAAGVAIWENMKASVRAIGEAFSSLGGVVSSALKGDFDSVGASWDSLKSSLSAPLAEGVSNSFAKAVEGANKTKEAIKDVSEAASGIGEGLGKAWDDYSASAGAALNSLTTTVSNSTDVLGRKLLRIPETVEPTAKSVEKLAGTYKKAATEIGSSTDQIGKDTEGAAGKAKKLNELNFDEVIRGFDSLRKQIESIEESFSKMAEAAMAAGSGVDAGMAVIEKKGVDAIAKWNSSIESLNVSLEAMAGKIERAKAAGPVDPKVIQYLEDYRKRIADLNNLTPQYLENVQKWVDLEKQRLTLQREVDVESLALQYSKLTGSLQEQLLVENQLIKAQQELASIDPAKAHIASIQAAIAAQKIWYNEMRATGSVIDGIKYAFGEMGKSASTAFDYGVEAARKAADAMENAFDDFFDALIDNPKNVVQSFKQMGLELVKTIAAIAAKAVLYPIVVPVITAFAGSLGLGGSSTTGGTTTTTPTTAGGINLNDLASMGKEIYKTFTSLTNTTTMPTSYASPGGWMDVGITAGVGSSPGSVSNVGGWADSLGKIGTNIGNWLKTPAWSNGPSWGKIGGYGIGGAISIGSGIYGLTQGGNWANYMGSSMQIVGGGLAAASLVASGTAFGTWGGPIGMLVGALGGLIASLFGGQDLESRIVSKYGRHSGKYGLVVKAHDIPKEAETSEALTEYMNQVFSTIEKTLHISIKKVLWNAKGKRSYMVDEGSDITEIAGRMADGFILRYSKQLAQQIKPGASSIINNKVLKDMQNEGELLADTFLRVAAVVKAVPGSINRINEYMKSGMSAKEAFTMLEEQAKAAMEALYSAVSSALNNSFSTGTGFDDFAQNVMMSLSSSLISNLDTVFTDQMSAKLNKVTLGPMLNIQDLTTSFMSGDIDFSEYKTKTGTVLDKMKKEVEGLKEEFQLIQKRRKQMVKEIEDALGITQERKIATIDYLKSIVADSSMTEYQKAKKALDDWFKDQKKLAEDMGINIKLVMDAYNVQLKDLQDQYGKTGVPKIDDDTIKKGSKEWKEARRALLDSINDTINGASGNELRAKVTELREWYKEQLAAAVKFDIPKEKVQKAFQFLLKDLITQALGASSDTIATSGMSDLGKQIYSIKNNYEEMTKALNRSGLEGKDLADALEQLEKAFGIAKDEIIDGFLKPFRDTIATAGMSDLGKQLWSLTQEFETNKKAALEAGEGIQEVTRAYWISVKQLRTSFTAPLRQTINTAWMTSYESSMYNLRKEYESNIKVAKELGVSVDLVTRAYQTQVAVLKYQFLGELKNAAVGMLPSYAQSLTSLNYQIAEWRRNAKALGVDMSLVNQLAALSKENLVSQLKAEQQQAKEAKRQEHLEQIQRAREEAQALRDAIKSSAQTVADSWKSLAESIQNQIEDMKFTSSNPATASQRVGLIQQEIDKITGGRSGAALQAYLKGLPQETAQEKVQKLQDLYGQLLSTGQEAYQRPSKEYQALYSSVLASMRSLEAFSRTRDTTQEVIKQKLYDISDYQRSTSTYTKQTSTYTQETSNNTEEIRKLIKEIEKQMREAKKEGKGLSLAEKADASFLKDLVPDTSQIAKHSVQSHLQIKSAAYSLDKLELITGKSRDRLVSIDKTLLSIEDKLSPEKKNAKAKSASASASSEEMVRNTVDIDMNNRFVVNEAFNAKKTVVAIEDWWKRKGLKMVDTRIRRAISK